MNNKNTGKSKQYYVYELRDSTCTDNIPFYVGKGIGFRVHQHVDDVKRKLKNGEDLVGDKETNIGNLLNKNIEIKELVIGRFDTEAQAFAVESTLIKWVYSIDNLDNAVQGHGQQFIRNKGDVDFSDSLDRERATHTERHWETIIERGLFDEGILLTKELNKYGVTNLSEPVYTVSQDFSLFWPVPGTKLQVQIKLLTSKRVSLLARYQSGKDFGCGVNEYYDHYINVMAEVGLLISHKNTKGPIGGAFAQLAEFNRNSYELTLEQQQLLEEKHNYLGHWAGGVQPGFDCSNPQEIVMWLRDFEARVKLAELKIKSKSKEKVTPEELDSVLRVFNKRPQAKRYVKKELFGEQP